MTTTHASLALARAVYPERAYAGPEENGNVWIRGQYNFPSPPHNSELFNPRTNADQFVDVLAWLFCQNDFNAVGAWYVSAHLLGEEFISIDHNGTRQSIIDAVVTAAEKVAAS